MEVYEDKKLINLMVCFIFWVIFCLYKFNKASSSFLLWNLDQKTIQGLWKISTDLNSPSTSMPAEAHMR